MFRMEILNEMYAENADAFFGLEPFRNNQVLEHNFEPPTIIDLFSGAPISMQEKEAREIRIIVADLAFSGSHAREKNDNTVFMCMSLHWKDFRFERHVDYIETRPGGGADKVVLRLKELFWDYQADYLVYDNRSGGEAIYDYLSSKTPHPQRGNYWNDCGFTLSEDSALQVVPQGKVEELLRRTVDAHAYPCLIPFIGTAENNSQAWQSLKKELDTNNIKFLIEPQAYQEQLSDTGEYFNLTAEQLADKVMPYIQVSEMIQECVELSAEYKNGLVRLHEPRSGYKDRAVVLAYANYVAELLDNKFAIKNRNYAIDLSEIQLVW